MVEEVRRRPNFVLDPSLALYLPLVELDGSAIRSRDACGHPSTVIGAFWSPRGRGFDGTDDRISIPASSRLTLTNGFTIIIWFRTNDVVNYQVVIGIGVGGGTPNTGDLRVDGNVLACYWNRPGAYSGRVGTTALSATAWYQAACVFCPDVSPLLYLNGMPEGTASGTPGALGGSGWQVQLGQTLYGDTAKNFDGIVGNILIYGRALTPIEIQNNYLATKWRYQ